MKPHIKTLVTAFRALPKADRDRLEYHRKKGTPICCGGYASFYTRRDGAG